MRTFGDTGYASPADSKKVLFGGSEVLIGQLAKRSGLSRDTIRYYEKLGLISVPARAAGSSYKVYGPECQRRLGDIAQLKKAGFTLREIRQLASDAAPCLGLPQRVQAKIESLDRKLEELTAYRESLARVERNCNEDCSKIRGLPDCVIPAAQGCCT
jgi:MerR family transcriptional regulator, copper efflux regulator